MVISILSVTPALKRSPKSGEKRKVIFGGENGISRLDRTLFFWTVHFHRPSSSSLVALQYKKYLGPVDVRIGKCPLIMPHVLFSRPRNPVIN